ncbi:MAG: DNA polymerase III subunit alpha [Holosporales bacterium]|nr:DNA polymerase III subunit alpha [Holosporales bacterium]
MIKPIYVPLRNHSAYSLLEGAIPLKKLIQKAEALALPALALCDSGNLFGAMEFALACTAAKIQPIIGCLLRLHVPENKGSRHASVISWYPFPVFVQNERGYRNLCQIVTSATVGQEADLFGHVSLAQLEGLTEGLIALSGGSRGFLNQALQQGRGGDAFEILQRLKSLFPERFYLELNRYGLPHEALVEEKLIEWAYGEHLPLIATNEAFFLEEDHYEAHDVLSCIAAGTYVGVPDRPRLTPHHRLKTPQEMQVLFADLPEALEQTLQMTQRCHFLLTPRLPLLPPYPIKDGKSEADTLRSDAFKGLIHRLGLEVTSEEKKIYEERLSYELEVIISMGFAGYFLIVADFIQWAKSQKIPVGPGRGSGASSLVAWALTITDVDPIRFNLLFERFLNPERVSMPDFDVDFCQERRDEVIRYVQEKYGKDHVAHIITFGKLQARAVLRDVGRVLQMSYGQVDGICKRIPNNPAHPVSLEEAIAQDPDLQELSKTDPQVEKLLIFGKQLEGLYRHASTHAAGIVIGGRPLVEFLPLYQDPRSILPATQFSMKYVESAGLIKFDFLGLKTLTILQETIHLLEKRGKFLDISTIPLDDPESFSLLRRVETVGIFQVESGGMSDVLRKLQPEAFEELIALVALYRPGPMDDIPRYIACRHGLEKVTYPYPCLEEILKETFGVMVYQEQVLQIARTLAGYSLGSADLLRRAMGKKIQSEMDAQRKTFVDGVLKNHGGSPEQASSLFDQIAKFAGYAFPKAHAAPYALITYQTAYLKANFPVEFMAASMNLELQNTEKLATLAREARRMGIPLLPPDINRSEVLFHVETVVDEGQEKLAIRYALAALKNVGEGAMGDMLAERQKAGIFKTVYDFFERLSSSKVLNKRQMEGLIQAGAFDSLTANRQELLMSLEILLKYGTQKSPMGSLFDVEETRPFLEKSPDFTPLERLRHEFAAIGFYISQHPLEVYTESLESLKITPSHQLLPFVESVPEGSSFLMAGVLMSKQEKTSKSGKKYAFLQVSDVHGVFEIILFSEALNQFRSLLEPGKPFLFTVTARLDGEQVRLSGQQIELLDHLLSARTPFLDVPLKGVDQLESLARLLKATSSQGETVLRIHLPLPDLILGEKCVVILRLSQPIHLSGDLKAALLELSEVVA